MQKSYATITLIVAICVIAALGIYLTQGAKHQTPNSTTIIPTNVTKWYGSSAAAAAKVAQNVNYFAIGLYSGLNNQSGNESANLLFSPFSISTALSMTAVGAGGITRTELDSELGLSNNSTENNMGFYSVLNGILPQNSAYNLSVADGVWVEQTFPINQTFVNTLSTYYDALARQTDFINNPTGATTDINNWVANKTNNKIINLIPPGAITALTRLVLVNAVHFKANWSQQFNLQETYNTSFFVSPIQNVTVPMMHQESGFPYYSNSQLKAIELNYYGSNITMLIILPNLNNGISTVESGLSAGEISGIEANLTDQQVELALPRFNITTQSIPMKSLLISLGIKSAFSSTANFSGINSKTELNISQVYHKAFIKVNEAGTEAAAATAVIMGTMAVANPVAPQAFNANHPFLFFIMDKKTGTILFMGKEANPASSS
jgi:serpin B